MKVKIKESLYHTVEFEVVRQNKSSPNQNVG